MILGIFDKKYDDEHQEITILHVDFWVGERANEKKYHKELKKGDFIIIVIIYFPKNYT